MTGLQKKIRWVCIISCLTGTYSLLAQGSATQQVPTLHKSLTIGDKVPDIQFKLVNSGPRQIRLSDFKEDLIILDFWSTTCGNCIENFPKMEAFENKHRGRLKVLLINSANSGDTEQKIQRFFERRKKLNKPVSLVSAIKDSMAKSLFPHESIPHYVWISNSRHVLAITGSDYVTAENIEKALRGDNIDLPVKNDDLDMSKPMFSNERESEPVNYRFRSLLTGYRKGLPSGQMVTVNNDGLIERIAYYNYPILGMAELVYPEIFNYPKSKRILQVSNPARLVRSEEWETWKHDNSFCYELMIPPSDKKIAYEYMRQDLKRYFGLTIYPEKREVNCLVLRHNGKKIPESKYDGPPNTNLNDEDGEIKFVKNYSVGPLVELLNEILSIPVINETNTRAALDLTLAKDATDLEALRNALQRYGFELKEEKRLLDVLVIRDQPQHPL